MRQRVKDSAATINREHTSDLVAWSLSVFAAVACRGMAPGNTKATRLSFKVNLSRHGQIIGRTVMKRKDA